jgi:hypothetical protein
VGGNIAPDVSESIMGPRSGISWVMFYGPLSSLVRPCRFDDPALRFDEYLGCIVRSLARLKAAGAIRASEAEALLMSARRACHEERD